MRRLIASSIGISLALAHRLAEQHGRVVERREEVEVRTGVARADDRARVAPHLHARLPRLVVVGPHGEAEAGHQVVGDDDVAQHVELVDAAFLGDLGDALPSHCLFSGANVSLMT